MKLIQFREPGSPSVLRCLEAPIPEPKPGEVLIRAHAIGVGIPDCLIRAGTYGHMPPLPATPGTELAGTIDKLGPGVTTLLAGSACLHYRARAAPSGWSLCRIRYGACGSDLFFKKKKKKKKKIRSPITSSTMPCSYARARPYSSSPPLAAWAMR